jgi:hypothetical protein
MIHELRTYTLKPNKAADFLKLTREVGYAIRTRHSKCAGYWTTEVGDLNQVVHLWEYDDFAHRTAVRTALAKDSDWTTKYLTHARECHRRQESTVLIPSDVWPFTPGEGNGVYELRSYRLHPGKVAEWLALFRKGLPVRAKYSAPVGVWSSELGRLNVVHHLWGYADLQARAEVRRQVMADAAWAETVRGLNPLMQDMRTKILVPTDFSPMR